MRTYKKETVTKEETIVDQFTCDVCGAVSPSEYDWSAKPDDEIVLETTVYFGHHNYSKPVGFRAIESITIDICPTCFKDKLVPAIEAMGGKVRREP